MININLFPWRESREKNRAKFLIMNLFFVFALVLFFLLTKGFLMMDEVSKKKEKIEMLKESVMLKEKKLENNFSMYPGMTEQNLAAIKIKMSENEALLNVMNFLGGELPESIYIKSIRKSPGEINVVGRAAAQEDVNDLDMNLKKRFENYAASIKKIAWVDEKGYQVEFEMVIILK